jgi:esterase/lipase superfamily enzyme
MELSREVMVQYVAHGKKNNTFRDDVEKKADIDCQFQVLTTGFWPSPNDTALKLPPELSIYRDR